MTLLDIASKYVEVGRLFADSVHTETDLDLLRRAGRENFGDPEVAIPIYRRILELDGSDLDCTVALATLYWLDGEDESARAVLGKAKQLDSDDIRVLMLEAALTKNNEERIALYEKILIQDPNNEGARENLEFINDPEGKLARGGIISMRMIPFMPSEGNKGS